MVSINGLKKNNPDWNAEGVVDSFALFCRELGDNICRNSPLKITKQT